jgi:hypothetical protein
MAKQVPLAGVPKVKAKLSNEVANPKPGPKITGMGYPNKPSGKGTKTRGNGAATQGTKAYGPLA